LIFGGNLSPASIFRLAVWTVQALKGREKKLSISVGIYLKWTRIKHVHALYYQKNVVTSEWQGNLIDIWFFCSLLQEIHGWALWLPLLLEILKFQLAMCISDTRIQSGWLRILLLISFICIYILFHTLI
jgi:hypothetical protein